MKLLVLADLHLDEITDPTVLTRLGAAIRTVGQDADLLIIAGDLTEAAEYRWPQAIHWLGTHYPTAQTVLFPGNHDYYTGNLTSLDATLDRICRDAGCSFGQCRTLVQGDVRVLMTTLWTDMRLFAAQGEQAATDVLRHAYQMMPDYGYSAIRIEDGERLLRPEDTVVVHAQQKAWLMSTLARPWAGKTVVVTHHAPLAAVSGAITPLSPCFASDLSAEIEQYRPDAWMFGHTHRAAELELPGGTLLRNVSIGFEDELVNADLEAWVRRGLIDLSDM